MRNNFIALDTLDLESLELDIASIRRRGSVDAYLESELGRRHSDLIIYKLERLLSELKSKGEINHV